MTEMSLVREMYLKVGQGPDCLAGWSSYPACRPSYSAVKPKNLTHRYHDGFKTGIDKYRSLTIGIDSRVTSAAPGFWQIDI